MEYAAHINEAGEYILTLINDLLDLATIEAGRVRIEEAEIDVREAIEDCLPLAKRAVGATAVTMYLDGAEDLPTLRADPRHLKQILLNLMVNALKFSEESGRVAITTDCADDGGIRIAVRDNGIGIDEADLARILEPFIQVAPAAKRKHAGKGLGLPICKSLVDLHGGTLNVASTLGRGTTVTVCFPPTRTVGGGDTVHS